MKAEHVTQTSKRLGEMSPLERSKWALQTFPPSRVIVSVSGNSAVTVDYLSMAREELGLAEKIPVLFVDNRLNETYSPTTLPYIAWMAARGLQHGYDLQIVRGKYSVDELRTRYPRWDESGTLDNERAKFANKEQPFNVALRKKKALLWVNGARRDEQASRSEIPFLIRRADGLLVLALLADLTSAQITEHNQKRELESNPEHFDIFKMLEKKKTLECGLLPYTNTAHLSTSTG